MRNVVLFDYSKLRGKIREFYGTQEAFANALGVSHVTLSAKLNNKVGFSQSEILSSCSLLDIDVGDIKKYFFAKMVQFIELHEEPK